jgi:Methyltransferase domain
MAAVNHTGPIRRCPIVYQENPRGWVWNRVLAPRIHQWGARPEHIAGIHPWADRLGEAGRLCLQAIQLRCGSAAELPFPDETFDLVLQSTAFTSVLDSGMEQRIAAEMLRLLQ